MSERMESFMNFTATNASFTDWCKQVSCVYVISGRLAHN
jgi:hypothetical protein